MPLSQSEQAELEQLRKQVATEQARRLVTDAARAAGATHADDLAAVLAGNGELDWVTSPTDARVAVDGFLERSPHWRGSAGGAPSAPPQPGPLPTVKNRRGQEYVATEHLAKMTLEDLRALKQANPVLYWTSVDMMGKKEYR